MMSDADKPKDAAERFLGKSTPSPLRYAPEVLTPIARALDRTRIGYSSRAEVPLIGVDVWHAYEVSCLLESGLPVAASLRVVYSAQTPFLVESKSLKLYFNSFNMERLGRTRSEALAKLVSLAAQDLSACVGGTVTVEPLLNRRIEDAFPQPALLLEAEHPMLSVEAYAEDRALLRESGQSGVLTVRSELLRSCCRITAQPDWGDVWVELRGASLPTTESLLAYLVSFRGEHHFHEEIVEAIFFALYTRFSPESLVVCARYTRRGGIDINPIRGTSPEVLRALFGPRWEIPSSARQ